MSFVVYKIRLLISIFYSLKDFCHQQQYWNVRKETVLSIARCCVRCWLVLGMMLMLSVGMPHGRCVWLMSRERSVRCWKKRKRYWTDVMILDFSDTLCNPLNFRLYCGLQRLLKVSQMTGNTRWSSNKSNFIGQQNNRLINMHLQTPNWRWSK